MTDIGQYIKEILKYEDSVVLQGLGSFITRYKSAEIKTKTASIAPPTKEILFDDKVKDDNGRLVEFICKSENSETEQVRNSIEKFVSETIIKLNHGEHVRIDDLGYLYKDKAYKIQFVHEASENILLDTFGLQEIEWEVAGDKSMPQALKAANVSGSPKKAFIIPIAILLVVILVFAILISDTLKSVEQREGGFLSGMFSTKASIEEYQDDLGNENEVIQHDDSLSEMQNALRFEENKYAGFNTFYLIAGSFSIYNNAEMYMHELTLKGYPAEVLEVDGKIFRVSVKAYQNRNEALADMERYQPQFSDKKLWVLSSR